MDGQLICNGVLGGDQPGGDQNSDDQSVNDQSGDDQSDSGDINGVAPETIRGALDNLQKCLPNPHPLNPYCWRYVAGVGFLWILPGQVE
ncbi:hypothetical protein ABT150_01985 [Streptomyces mirabilis]|uniref:hypothetical protein n=1 Tax=Streptomyces mirabilis TaxID=68239 RepID=UPI0033313913